MLVVSKNDNSTSAQAQAVVATKDGSENASYSSLGVGKAAEEGKSVFRGSAVWITDSTNKLGIT